MDSCPEGERANLKNIEQGKKKKPVSIQILASDAHLNPDVLIQKEVVH